MPGNRTRPMPGDRTLPAILIDASLDGLLRIDVALEGDWNATVTTVWTRDRGRLGFDSVVQRHRIARWIRVVAYPQPVPKHRIAPK